jgi:hypothetical protein
MKMRALQFSQAFKLALTILVVAGGGCQENLKDHDLFNESKSIKHLELMDGTLKFSSIQEYDDFFEDPEKFVLPKFSNAFDIFSNYQNGISSQGFRINDQALEILDDLKDSPFIKLLDENFMIILGEYCFSLDFNNELVGVTKNFSLVNNLKVKDFNHSDIMIFSFDDTILEILENNNIETVNARINLFCSDRSASGDMEKEKYYEYNDPVAKFNYQVKVKHGYQKAGIYFSLMTQIKHMSKPMEAGFFTPWSSSNTYLRLNNRYSKFKPRCRDEENGSTNLITESWDNKINDRPYSSTRGLARYEIKSSYIFEERSVSNTGRLVTITLDDLKDGY